MTHKLAQVTPASAVASSGTFTASYPTGTNAGTFAAYGHRIFSRGLQAYFSQDDGLIAVSFGASSITVTYYGSTSIPANSLINCEFNIAGDVTPVKDLVGPDLVQSKRLSFKSLMKIDLGAPITADADGYCASQDLTSAGVFSVSTTAAAAIAAAALAGTADVPRNVVAAWTGTAILTVTGTDEYGNVMIEKSGSGTSLTGKKAFKTVTGISSSANITSLTVGTGDVLGLPVYVDKVARIIAETQDGVLLSKLGNNKILIPFDFTETDLLAPTAQNLVAPCAGYITGIRGIVQKAVTTGGAITVEANTVAVVGLSVTVADAAAAGVTHSDDVLKIATGLCAAGDDITVTPASAFATAGAYKGYLIFEPIAGLNGTFVAGVQTAATATTGDVRGTYDPAEACNGSLAFGLIVELPDPNYKGVDQYDG